MSANNENLMEKKMQAQVNTAQARETSSATTADGGVSYAYSCGYATIDRTESMLEKAGKRLMDELHHYADVAIAERRREDDARQQRYLARQNRQAEQAKTARVQAQANAEAKKAEAMLAQAQVKMKELELRERDIALREKEFNAKVETAEAIIEKKKRNKVEDDGELY